MVGVTQAPAPDPLTLRDRLLAATYQCVSRFGLAKTTIEDVAKASGHHHRFVQAWFGGKVGLLRAAFDRLLEDAVRGIPSPFVAREGFNREVRTAASLMNWLMAADPGSLDPPRPRPIVERVIEIYRTEFDLDDDLARLMALRLVSGATSIILFSGPLGIANDDLPALMQLEIDLARLLSRSRAIVD